MRIIIISLFVITIIIHHFMKHKRLSGLDRWFQLSDIMNHESWVLFFIGVIVGMIIGR